MTEDEPVLADYFNGCISFRVIKEHQPFAVPILVDIGIMFNAIPFIDQSVPDNFQPVSIKNTRKEENNEQGNGQRQKERAQKYYSQLFQE